MRSTAVMVPSASTPLKSPFFGLAPCTGNSLTTDGPFAVSGPRCMSAPFGLLMFSTESV